MDSRGHSERKAEKPLEGHVALAKKGLIRAKLIKPFLFSSLIFDQDWLEHVESMAWPPALTQESIQPPYGDHANPPDNFFVPP